jgi:hypothetical protein
MRTTDATQAFTVQGPAGPQLQGSVIPQTITHTTGPHGPVAKITVGGIKTDASGDTTNDLCETNPASWSCGIQGQNFQITWQYPTLPGGESVSWHVTLPSGFTASFNPQTATVAPYSTVMTVTLPSTAKVQNNYSYTIQGTCTPTSPYCESGTGYFMVECSNNAKHCPQAEILDERHYTNDKPTEVEGSPPPVQQVAIGQEMDLLSQWKSGTGTAGSTYAVDNTVTTPSWGLGGFPIKSFTLNGSDVVQLSPLDLGTAEINFYWQRGAIAAGDPVSVDLPLVRNDGEEHAAASAYAQYQILMPTVSVFTLTQKSQVAVGPDDVPQVSPSPSATPKVVEALGVGDIPYPNPSPGVAFDFEATAPTVSGGYLAATQIIGNQILTQPGNIQDGGTNYVNELDTCVLYTNAVNIAAGKLGKWLSDDSPEEGLASLGSGVTELDRDDYYNTVFIWLPYSSKASGSQPARKSTWITLGVWYWNWAASAKRTNASSPWTGPYATANGSGPWLDENPAPTSSAAPVWTGVYQSTGAACPTVPS